jgi:peptidylprolyl isomerase
MSRLRLRTATLAALAVGALGLAACASSTPSSTATTSGGSATTSTSPTTTAAPTASSPIAPVQSPSPAGAFGTKPVVTPPTGTPPSQLESTDLIAGTGAAVVSTDTVTVQYVGVAWSNGKQFDASWDRGAPATFALNQVIPGWTQGMVGMKVGGRRELVIPPSLGYGANPPQGSGIAVNDTLIFIIDLVKIG